MYTVQHYSFHGQLPGYEKNKLNPVPNNDPDKQAFNSALGPEHDDPFMRPSHEDPEAAGGAQNTSYGGGGRYDDSHYAAAHEGPDDFGSYGRQTDPVGYQAPSYGHAGSDTGYGGAASVPPAGSGPYDEGPVRFPTANYGNL